MCAAEASPTTVNLLHLYNAIAMWGKKCQEEGRVTSRLEKKVCDFFCKNFRPASEDSRYTEGIKADGLDRFQKLSSTIEKLGNDFERLNRDYSTDFKTFVERILPEKITAIRNELYLLKEISRIATSFTPPEPTERPEDPLNISFSERGITVCRRTEGKKKAPLKTLKGLLEKNGILFSEESSCTLVIPFSELKKRSDYFLDAFCTQEIEDIGTFNSESLISNYDGSSSSEEESPYLATTTTTCTLVVDDIDHPKKGRYNRRKKPPSSPSSPSAEEAAFNTIKNIRRQKPTIEYIEFLSFLLGEDHPIAQDLRTAPDVGELFQDDDFSKLLQNRIDLLIGRLSELKTTQIFLTRTPEQLPTYLGDKITPENPDEEVIEEPTSFRRSFSRDLSLRKKREFLEEVVSELKRFRPREDHYLDRASPFTSREELKRLRSCDGSATDDKTIADHQFPLFFDVLRHHSTYSIPYTWDSSREHARAPAHILFGVIPKTTTSGFFIKLIEFSQDSGDNRVFHRVACDYFCLSGSRYIPKASTVERLKNHITTDPSEIFKGITTCSQEGMRDPSSFSSLELPRFNPLLAIQETLEIYPGERAPVEICLSDDGLLYIFQRPEAPIAIAARSSREEGVLPRAARHSTPDPEAEPDPEEVGKTDPEPEPEEEVSIPRDPRSLLGIVIPKSRAFP